MDTNTNRLEQRSYGFEARSCTCSECVAGCQTMPAFLAPGDADAIADYLGIEPSKQAAWAAENLRRSEGAKVAAMTPIGMIVYQIGTIVPAQREDGSCIWLDGENRCEIHAVKPYGCRYCCICETSESDNRRAGEVSKAALADIMEDGLQKGSYYRLRETLPAASPVAERKAALAKKLGLTPK